MRSLAQKIKTSLEKCTALQWQSLGLWLICFVIMFAVRYKSAWQWDDVAYLKNIIRGLPSDLLLGRPGFMYPFIWLWVIVRKFGVSFYLVEDTIRIAGIIFLSTAYVFLFRILVAVSVSARVAFLTVIFVLSEFSFSIISSRVGDSALMYLCVTASYFYFIKAHHTGKVTYLMLSSFLFGYAFLTREPALSYFPFYLVLLIYFHRQNKLFQIKNYFKGVGLMLVTCISAVALIALYYGTEYLDTLKFSSASGYVMRDSDFITKLGIVWSYHVNYILLPLAVGGLVLLYKKQGASFSAAMIVCCLAPLFPGFLTEDGLLMEPRLFLGLFCLIAFGTAYLTDSVFALIKNTRLSQLALATAAFVVMFVSASRFFPQYQADLKKISEQEDYYESIKPLLGKNVVVILGEETLYVAYRGMVDGIGPYFISPGWSWPGGKLNEVIDKSLAVNLTVIYDPRGRSYLNGKRVRDLDQMMEAFTLTETKNGFFEVSRKK